jgi:Ca2+-binding RTX toxin-like protein
MLGGSGNDTITGNFGNDTMTGNAGADRFVWQSNDNYAWGLNPDDAEAGTPFVDRITDFGAGDILDLSDLIKNGSNTDATDFVKFKAVSGGTMVSAAKSDGAAFHDVVFLAGVTLTNVEAAQDAGWLII